jgi:hypothetical protein
VSSSKSLMTVPFPQRLNSDVPVSKSTAADSPRLHNILTRYLPEQVVPRKGIPIVVSWANASYGANVWKEETGWMPYISFLSPDNRKLLIGTVGPNVRWTYYYTPEEILGTISDTEFAMKGQSPSTAPPYNLGYIEVDLVSGSYSANTYKGVSGIQANWWGNAVHYDNCTLICTGADATKTTHDSKYWDGGHRWEITSSADTAPVTAPIVWGGKITAGNADGGITTSATVTVTQNNTTFTFGSSPTNGVNGRLAWFVPATTSPKPKYQYVYRVKKQTSSTAGVFDRPYGLGETGATGGSVTMNFTDFAPLSNAPLGVQTLAIFRERVFGARGHISETIETGTPQNFPDSVEEFGGYYGNAIFWSKPGQYNKWPDQNFALVDNDSADPITSLCAIEDMLVIFKASKMFVLTGFDEESFTIRKVSNVVGCPYPNGFAVYEGVIYFVSEDGVYAYSNGNLTSLTAPAADLGISNLWTSLPWSVSAQRTTNNTHPEFEYYWPTLAVTPNGHLIVCVQYIEDGYDPADMSYNFVYDLQSGSWATWGFDNPEHNPMRVVQASNGRVYGVHQSFVSELTDVFDPTSTLVDYDGIPDPINTDVTWSDAPSTWGDAATWGGVAWEDGVPGITVSYSGIPIEFDMYIKPSLGRTSRINEIQIDHGVYATQSGKTTWNIGFVSDPDMSTATTSHTIKARYKITTVQPWAAYHFSDRFPETFQREGQTIRVAFSCLTDTSLTNAIKSYRLYNLFLVAGDVRTMGVDNSAV